MFESWDKFENKEFELVIIGAKKSLNSKMLESFELKNVTFLDELNNSETLKIISKARAVVTATRMYEGQPRLLSEALSMGIPTIYPYFGGMKQCDAVNDYNDFKKEELVCGKCSAVSVGGGIKNCKTHGTDFIEFKCKFCCSIA